MNKQLDKKLFWAIVEDCLKEIYKIKPARACELTNKLRQEVEQSPTLRFRNLFYHAEPIHVASDMAGKKEDELDKEKWETYDAILARHNW